jgi:hypothetical protein
MNVLQHVLFYLDRKVYRAINHYKHLILTQNILDLLGSLNFFFFQPYTLVMHILNVSIIFSNIILLLGKGYINIVYLVMKPYFIHSAPVYSTQYKAPYLPFPGISNISLVTESFLELMRHAVNGQVQANGTLILPWIKFLKVLFESDNSTLPTIVPHQVTRLFLHLF